MLLFVLDVIYFVNKFLVKTVEIVIVSLLASFSVG